MPLTKLKRDAATRRLWNTTAHTPTNFTDPADRVPDTLHSSGWLLV